jgi:signal transduction histidine kinase
MSAWYQARAIGPRVVVRDNRMSATRQQRRFSMERKLSAPFSAAEEEDPLAQPSLSSGRDDARIAQEFMLTRRLRLILVVARSFGFLLSLFLLVYVALFAWQLPADQRIIGWIAVVVLVGCDALFFAAARAAARKRLPGATISLLLGVDVASIWFLFFWSTLLGHRGDPFSFVQLVSLAITIMLAGTFGNARLALATTLLMNVVTLAFGLAYASSELGLFLLTGILDQWAVFTIAAVMASSYRETLRDLSAAYTRTRQLDELKEHFITNVHHELRTPVMTVLGYLDFLQHTWQTLPPEQLSRGFEKAHEVGTQLMRLIESILDVRRIDETVLEQLEPVALQAVCAQALQLVDPREAHLEGRDVSLAIPEGLMVLGEPTRLQQVMTNLLSNAGKYSPPGTPIEVAARVVSKAAREKPKGKRGQQTAASRLVEITVRDYGFGIPPDQAPLLFNRFVRLPRDLASTTVGNGLGLYLCRSLVTAMRGTIWVESSGVSGEGSTFHLQLVLSYEATPAGG